jgi:phosphoribosylformimino-5-aminoimidazole carboxamide ribotide isomerase
MHFIPAIDIIDGQCVRLTQGDFSRKKVYSEDPLKVAKQFEAAGLQRLHLVDLDGARAGHIVNHRVLERIAANTSLWIDFGGGLKSDDDVRIAFESGARQITGGTVAVKNPELFLEWLQQYGPEKIILGADVKDGKIAVSGWEEQSRLELFEFLENYTAQGVRYAICTDVSKDGLLQGPATDLYRRIRLRFPDLNLIASGGVSGMKDIREIKQTGCFGVIVGKAIYEGRIGVDGLMC